MCPNICYPSVGLYTSPGRALRPCTPHFPASQTTVAMCQAQGVGTGRRPRSLPLGVGE